MGTRCTFVATAVLLLAVGARGAAEIRPLART